MFIQNFVRNPVLVNNRFQALRYRAQTLASNLAKSQVLSESGPDAPNERVIGAVAKSLTHAVSEVMAYAAEGIGQYLNESRRDFMLRCIGALARKARLVSALIASEKHLRYVDRRQPADLERSVLPETRTLIAGGGVNVGAEVAQLDLSDWPGQEAARAILAILFYCLNEVMAQDAHWRLARHLVECWEADRDRRNPRQRNYHLEFEYMKRLARFVMWLPVATALAICEPLLHAVDEHPSEVARFVEDLVVIEDQVEGDSPFWDIWQAFADRVQTTPWIQRLDSRYASDAELLHTLFFGVPWKDGVRHWRRLEGFADRVDTLFEGLPPCAPVL